MRDALATAGVDVTHVANAAVASGHAIVMVDSVGENSIVIHPGANRALDFNGVEAALHDARPSDWLLMQNETNCQVEAARMAHGRGMRVAYSAAPFDARSVQAVIPYLTLLILNAAEAAQLFQMVGEVLVPRLLITRGADGRNGATSRKPRLCLSRPFRLIRRIPRGPVTVFPDIPSRVLPLASRRRGPCAKPLPLLPCRCSAWVRQGRFRP